VNDLTPVIIGVGEASERLDAPDYRALSPADLAGLAARAALDDALSAEALAPHVELIGAIRQFEVSAPWFVPPFGASNNFPRSVARRIGADPVRAVLEPVGGQGPQHLLNDLAQEIGRGELKMALLVGAEAISTQRHLMSKGEKRDWSETVEGSLEDRGFGESWLTEAFVAHGAKTPINRYALCENARRARLGLDRDAYRLEMGRLFAPFTKVAAANPHAMAREVLTPEALATVTPSNRLTSDPYPRRLVSRDQTNQGAAVLIASLGQARALGVPEDRFVYLHGGADATERTMLERQDMSSSPASVMAARRAMELAGVGVGQVELFDLYSCFPIAVFNIRDGLGIAADDPRPLTLTGGLPFFGGAGNNYSMHGIACMTRALRARPTAMGLVGANGGDLSKYSVGVYSARPAAWTGFSSKAMQAGIDAWPAPAQAGPTSGTGVVQTYIIDYSGPAPTAMVIGALDQGGARFMAMSGPDGAGVVQTMIEREPLGARVTLAPDGAGHTLITSITPTR
jgi:acetyl-CoA C-acetyltransferase